MTSMNGRRGRAQEADDAAAAGSLDSLSANTLTLVLSGSALVAPLMAASLLPSALTMLALDEGGLVARELVMGELFVWQKPGCTPRCDATA